MNVIEKNSIPEPNSGCWLWTRAADARGYGFAQFDGRVQRAHRVSWQEHNGDIPDGDHVLHRCDNPSCVNPAHLFLGTHADNMRDMANKGRSTRGEGAARARLSDDSVRAIRAAYSAGAETQEQIGRRFGTSGQNISRIVAHKRWAHLEAVAA